ncbi:MAG TPA: alpha/beta hydrolase [Fibrobacteria bacterium]|nr:alpha/beta hydrolase [Fibrobacteria bacterium]
MRVFLITGFALDKRAFALMDLPADVYRALDLVPVLPGETLRAYARRMAAEIGLAPGDVIGGVSLGGMLALEMAKAVDVSGVLLIASATHPRHIRKRFKMWSPLAGWVPEFLIRRIFTLIPRILAMQNMLSPEGQALLADIMGRFPPALLKTFPRMILGWPGCEPPANFRHIHSDGDWLIRPAGDPATLTLLSGKNHLITVSHPAEVRELVLQAVADFQIAAKSRLGTASRNPSSPAKR